MTFIPLTFKACWKETACDMWNFKKSAIALLVMFFFFVFFIVPSDYLSQNACFIFLFCTNHLFCIIFECAVMFF